MMVIKVRGAKFRLVESARGSWSAFANGRLVASEIMDSETKYRIEGDERAWRLEMDSLRELLIKKLRSTAKSKGGA